MAAVVLVALILMVTVAPLWADNAGSTAPDGSPSTNVNFGNNSTHKIDIVTLNTQNLDATRDLIDYYDVNTEITMYEINIGGGSETADVEVRDADYGDNGLAGWVICPDGATTSGSHPYRSCFTQILRYNTNYSRTDAQADRRACHEMGHTLALKHANSGANPDGTDSCMWSPSIESTGFLTDHDKDIVNYFY